MDYRATDTSEQIAVAELFTSVFTASEGRTEGERIGKLSSALAARIDNEGRICFGAYDGDALIGSIFFTRLRFDDPAQVYMLAPVAVATKHQRRGVGKALIGYGLKELQERSVRVAVTYGDPSYYSKVGFQALSEDVLPAPLELSMPFGWLGQSLTAEPIPSFKGRSSCVEEFNDPALW